MKYTDKTCPECASECERDKADVGIGIMYGPWGCRCGWSEQEEYNYAGKSAPIRDGCRIDSRGGLTPLPPEVEKAMDDLLACSAKVPFKPFPSK